MQLIGLQNEIQIARQVTFTLARARNRSDKLHFRMRKAGLKTVGSEAVAVEGERASFDVHRFGESAQRHSCGANLSLRRDGWGSKMPPFTRVARINLSRASEID